MLEISSGYGMGVRCDIGTEAWLRLCLVQVISIIVNIHEVCCRYGGGNAAMSGRGHQQVMNMHDGCWTYDGGIGGGTWICMRYGVGVEAGLQLCLAEVISIIVNIHEVCCRYGGRTAAVSGRGHQQVMNMHEVYRGVTAAVSGRGRQQFVNMHKVCCVYRGGIGGGTWICMRCAV